MLSGSNLELAKIYLSIQLSDVAFLAMPLRLRHVRVPAAEAEKYMYVRHPMYSLHG